MLPAKILDIHEIAAVLNKSTDWVRRVANDATKPPKERRYPADVHASFPPLKKQGRTWTIWGPRLQAHLEKVSRKR